MPANELLEAAQVERLAYTRRQAAEALGMSVSTIDRRVVPVIDSVKTPWGQRLIPATELDRFLWEHLELGSRVTPLAEPDGRQCSPGLSSSASARVRTRPSLAEIARGLSSEGVPTAHGGRKWWPSTMRALLLRASVQAP